MPDADKELDVTVAGQHVRAKGYRLIDLIWLPMILGIGYIGLVQNQHVAAAAQDSAAIANAIKESNANVVAAMKESAAEQRRSTSAMKEVACLSDPALKNRQDAREFCKRMAGSDR